MADFQRNGAISNAHVGREFEILALKFFSNRGLELNENHSVDVGVNQLKKKHVFDLGSDKQKIIIECKSHKWTSGNNVPSAKITVWNEAMYYFMLAPSGYRKIFFVLRDLRASNNESLANYYIRRHKHMIPTDVEIWEYDLLKKEAFHLNA